MKLVDLERGPTTYRVLLLPHALQLDLSVTPAAQFAPTSPRFRLLFGETAGTARACIERGRAWQGEHYIGAVRDHAAAIRMLLDEGRQAGLASADTVAQQLGGPALVNVKTPSASGGRRAGRPERPASVSGSRRETPERPSCRRRRGCRSR